MSDRYIIAIDIGTTNIEAALVKGSDEGGESGKVGVVGETGESGGRIMSTIFRPNVNSRYGRDVMTRITQAERGNLHQMSMDLRQQLSEMIGELVREGCPGEAQGAESDGSSDGGSYADKECRADLDASHIVDITRIVVACNTTMTHILLEEDCHNLGVYPFSPVHIEEVDIMSSDIGLTIEPYLGSSKVLLGRDGDGTAEAGQHSGAHDGDGSKISHPVPLTILPGFSAYVGGDIMSGVISLDLFKRPGRSLLIDLGTNGEMVYHDADSGKTFVTSTAAGPAFELAGRAKATEIIEGIAHLREQGIVDETGLLSDEYFDSGYRYNEVNITQQLIRDVQTAKSAIRSGIEILLNRAGIGAEDLNSIFVSGAFGDHLDIDAAVSIGMFPEAFSGRVTLCGNTSLSGAVCVALDKTSSSPLGAVAALSTDAITEEASSFEEIYLANDPDFNDIYIDNIGL